MMAKVLIFFFALTQLPSVQQNPAGVSSCSLFQSCAEGEEEEDEEGKEKTFEVPVISQEHCFAFLFSLHWERFHGLIQEKEMEKQKMLYQQARLHDRGAAEMVLQMISASKGRNPFNLSDVLELPATVWCGDCVMNCGPQVDLVLWWLSPLNWASPSSTGGTFSSSRYASVQRDAPMSPTPSAHFLLRLCVGTENAGLPEGETRCWVFQKFVWTHDVVQVKKLKPALTHKTKQENQLFLFCFWRFSVILVYIHLVYPNCVLLLNCILKGSSNIHTLKGQFTTYRKCCQPRGLAVWKILLIALWEVEAPVFLD